MRRRGQEEVVVVGKEVEEEAGAEQEGLNGGAWRGPDVSGRHTRTIDRGGVARHVFVWTWPDGTVA